MNMRIRERSISRNMILDSVSWYEIIEEYPKDKYFPSYLVYSKYMDTVFHVVFAVDVEDNNVRVVTAYHPDPAYWEDDLKTRRKQ